MTIELIQALKDAGFPIKEFLYDEKMNIINPTLEELIAACGKEFHELHYCRYGFAGSEKWLWTAYPHTHDQYTFNAMQFKGQAPEEAVARLWLALQANK